MVVLFHFSVLLSLCGGDVELEPVVTAFDAPFEGTWGFCNSKSHAQSFLLVEVAALNWVLVGGKAGGHVAVLRRR